MWKSNRYNYNGKRTKEVKRIAEIRKKIFNKYLGAKWDWKAEKNIFYLESTKKGATTWVHIDVREFNLEYLKDEFFTKAEEGLKGDKIFDLAKSSGYIKTCDCLGAYNSQNGGGSNKIKSNYKWAHSEFGNLISENESRNNYNICNKTKIVNGRRKSFIVNDIKVVETTIKEIQTKQKSKELFAVGRYQLIPKTLKEAVISLSLDESTLLDEDVQDKIFDEFLIDKKRPKIIAYLERDGSIEDAMHSAAKEWASIGVEKGKKLSKNRVSKGGESYYAGYGLNKAHITPEQIKKSLINSKNENQ